MVLKFATLILFAAAAAVPASGKEPIRSFLYGEKNFEHYHGPGHPYFNIDKRFGKTVFEGEKLLREKPLRLLQPELLGLSEFFEDMRAAAYCPDSELAGNAPYLRYLYRMAALSYLDEYLSRMETVAKKLRLGKVCGEDDLGKLLERCRPVSEDMKLFVNSASVLASSFEEFTPAFDFPFKSFYREWRQSLEDGDLSFLQARVSKQCGSECGKLDRQGLGKAFRKTCAADKELFVSICSEQDRLWGMSWSPRAYRALADSDALKPINGNGNALGCLARFSKLMSYKEVYDPVLDDVFAGVYERLRATGNLAGRLSPAGSLKAYVDKGLEEIFVAAKPDKKVVPAPDKAPKTALKLAPLAPEPIKRALKPVSKKEKTPAKAADKEPKKAPAKSYFLKSAVAREEFGLESLKLDMLKFELDYVFSAKTASFLDGQMEKFASREGLQEMKKFDSLGQKKGPVPLLFVKYLIDQDRHQGLTNLTEVLGERFYVRNNIDPPGMANKRDYVRLSFEPGSEHVWQLRILEAPSTNTPE